MITIDHPSVRTEYNTTTLSYPIRLEDGQTRELSFTTDARFGEFLNPDYADGVLIALLPWIARHGGKVCVLPAISPRLYHFGIRLLSHILTGIGPFLKPIEIVGNVTMSSPETASRHTIGTGGSLGVDSLCTIVELAKNGTPVTHLFHNNCGSHWGDDELRNHRRRNSQLFAETQGMEFVWMDSTLYDFYGNEGYLNFFPFLDGGSILSLHGLFGSYWLGSTYNINHPEFTIRDNRDYCEFHLQPHILAGAETEYTRFNLHGLDLSRYEKTAILADYPPAHDFLNVCLERGNNCGRCLKCRRTIAQLHMIGKLSSFADVFELQAFQENPVRFLARAIVQSGHFKQEMFYLLKHSTTLSSTDKRRILYYCMRKKPSLLFHAFQ